MDNSEQMKIWHLVFLIGLSGGGSLAKASTIDYNYLSKWELKTQFALEEVLANFDSSGGGFDRLPSGHSHRVMKVVPQLRYAFGQLGLLVGTYYGYGISEDSNTRRTNGAIDHLSLGADYAWISQSRTFVPRFRYGQSYSPNNLSGDVVAIGEGIRFIELGALAYWPNFYMPFRLDLSYHNRESFAQLFKFESAVIFPIRSWDWGIGLGGYFTLIGENGNQVQRSNWFCRANGCSAQFLPYNPQKIYTQFDFKTNRGGSTQWGGFLQYAINGARAAQDVVLGVNFIWRSSQTSGSSGARPARPVFIEDTKTNVDEDLFSRPRVLNPSKTPPKVAPQQQLDQIEMQIELKQKKNRPNRR